MEEMKHGIGELGERNGALGLFSQILIFYVSFGVRQPFQWIPDAILMVPGLF